MKAFAIPPIECDRERACVREILSENNQNDAMTVMAYACVDGDLDGATVDAVCAINCWPVGNFARLAS